MTTATREDRDKDLGDRLATLRRELELDAVIVSSPINTHFLSGCLILTQRLLPDRLALIVNTEAGGDTFVVCDIEERQVRAKGRISDVRGYAEFTESPIEMAASVLGEFGVNGGVVGIESAHLPAQHYHELHRCLPDAELVGVDRPLAVLRAVKTQVEIDLLRSGFQATDRAIASSYSAAPPAESTRQIAARMKTALLEDGADEITFAVIGGGRATLEGHPFADDDALEAGDAIRVDFGGLFHGYHTDVARTAFFRSASRPQRDDYRRLWASLEETIAVIRPGIEARDAYAAASVALKRNGLSRDGDGDGLELSHVGHGIGLDIHEFPILEPSESHSLEAGTILCVELLYTEPERYRMHVEDAVLITDSGGEVLSRSRDWSEPVILGATT